MNSSVSNFTTKPIQAGALAFAAAIALAATPAFALTSGTASNTQISNTASVAFNDAGGNVQTPVTSAPALVTVQLVQSAPNVSSPAAVSANQGQTTTLTYTITSTANGPDTYTIAAADAQSNITGGSATPSTTSLQLGGTSLAAAAPIGATTITVPYDQNPSTATINGLTAGPVGTGSVVVIGGNTYTITAINKTGSSTSNVVTLTLDHAIAGTAGTVNSIVPEQKTFTVSVPSGTVTTGSSGTQTVTVTATSGNGTGPAGTQGTPTVVTINRPTLTVTKQVSTDGGVTYTSNPLAPPGSTLTYKITASNTGTSNATAVSFSDAIPQFLTYKTGTGKTATASATLYSAATALTDNANGYTISGSTVTFAPTGTPVSGTVAGSGVLVLFFQVTIN